MHRIRHAGTGETPTADRGTNQAARLGRTRQPLAEQRQIQPLNAQRLGAAGSTGNHVHVGWLQPVLADMLNGAMPCSQRQCRSANLDGCHAVMSP